MDQQQRPVVVARAQLVDQPPGAVVEPVAEQSLTLPLELVDAEADVTCLGLDQPVGVDEYGVAAAHRPAYGDEVRVVEQAEDRALRLVHDPLSGARRELDGGPDGAITELASDLANPSGFALLPTGLAIANTGDGTIVFANAADAEEKPLAWDQNDPYAIVHAADGPLFWTNRAGGEIVRLDPPFD